MKSGVDVGSGVRVGVAVDVDSGVLLGGGVIIITCGVGWGAIGSQPAKTHSTINRVSEVNFNRIPTYYSHEYERKHQWP